MMSNSANNLWEATLLSFILGAAVSGAVVYDIMLSSQVNAAPNGTAGVGSENSPIQSSGAEPTIESINAIAQSNAVSTDETIPDESMLLPSIPTNVKSFTDYRVYNLRGTPHYRLQARCGTDEFGMRRFGADYCVAVGSFYSIDIGDRFEVALDTGSVFTVIVADTKADRDTDALHMFAPCENYDGEKAANVLEFIVDSDLLPPEAYAYGSVDCIAGFGGDIQQMIYLGRDESGDWTSYE